MPADAWPVEVDPHYGCWLWRQRIDGDGYARTKSGALAYRIVYEAEVGPIADGLEPDHTCRRRECCAPHHLDLVTREENERRKRWRRRLKITHCPRGHELTSLVAIVTPQGGRVCRTCRDE